MGKWIVNRAAGLALVLMLLAGCATQPDLVRLYEGVSDDPNQPPVIVIHGLAGSTLVDAQTGKQFWPGSLSTLTFSNYTELAQMTTGMIRIGSSGHSGGITIKDSLTIAPAAAGGR